MSKKQTTRKPWVSLTAALVLWLFASSAMAQSSQPAAKPVVSKRQQVSMSNTSPDAARQKEVEQKRNEAYQQAQKDAVMQTKKKAEAEEQQRKSNQTKAAHVGNPTAASKSSVGAGDVRKDWEKKKAKLVEDFKSKGMSQYEIDKEIKAIEEKLNINTNNK